jgi:hypothetical protein
VNGTNIASNNLKSTCATILEMTMPELAQSPNAPENLVAELRQLISEARRQAAATVNVAPDPHVLAGGDRIRRSILGNERAGYGEGILATLSQFGAASR